MNGSRRTMVMFVILLGSVVFGLYMKPWQKRMPSGSDDAGLKMDAVAAPASPAVADPSHSPTFAAASEYQRIDWPSDPFQRNGEEETADATSGDDEMHSLHELPQLQGIMASGDSMACVLNGQLAHVGESVGEWTIEQIDGSQVWVSRGSERRRLDLP